MSRAIVVLSLALILIAAFPSHVYAALTLGTDHPLYTLRDAQATLTGSGFSNQPYYVWVKGPNDNRTLYSGVSFTPISGGYIPPAVGLPISAESPLGTYIASISSSSTNDTSQAIAHYGIWGAIKPLFQRTETAKIVGGGLFPGTSIKLSIRNPAGDYVITSTIVVTSNGNFNYSWRIPVNAVTETYKILLDGTGTLDNAQQDYVSEARFGVTPAALVPKISLQTSDSYQRTAVAKSSLSLTYPDESPVVTISPDTHPVILLQNQSTVGFAMLSLVDQANGVWNAEVKLPVNATISSKYRFELPATSFDDSYGNKGGQSDIFTDYFKVTNASLTITSSINGTQIQIPFGQVSIISKILYPDGTPLTNNGTVSVTVSTGSSTSVVALSYDPGLGAWHGSYSSSFSDIWHVGTWTLKVEARDEYGNSGNTSYQVSAQPYLVLAIVGAILFLAFVGRWIFSRYGRRLYFRTRKMIQRFRRGGSSL